MKFSIPSFVCAAAFAFASVPVSADTWPTKPVRIVLPGPTAGSPDRLSRSIAERLSKMWRQSVHRAGPEVARQMRDQGVEPFIAGPAQLATIASQSRAGAS